MKKRIVVLVAAAAVLGTAAPAVAAPPALTSVGTTDRHPTATFTAPRAADVTVYIATSPAVATDGSFLDENVEDVDILTDDEIQAGRWLDASQLDPGVYYVMLRASADFASCFMPDTVDLDPACADGYSTILPLTIPRPASRYTTSVKVYSYLHEADLRLTATPLGGKLPYRLCYRTRTGQRRCLSHTLSGYDWSSAASDTLMLSTRQLARSTTFTWYAGSTVLASRRVRIA